MVLAMVVQTKENKMMRKEYCPVCYAEIVWATGDDKVELAFDVQSVKAAILVLAPCSKRTYELIPTHTLHEDTCPYKEE